MKILVLANKKSTNYKKAIEYFGAHASVKYLSDTSIDYDGLVLCGGNDIHPSFYGEEIRGAEDFDIERDKYEMEITKAFLDTGKPILAICRGMQLLNVALGGSLIQHINSSHIHRSEKGIDLVHKVEAKGFLKDLYGKELFVNSFHHQAIKDLGKGLFPIAFCDGIIEAFEDKSRKILGVQFHPERMCLDFERNDTVNGLKIFEYFISLVKKDFD